MKKVTINGVIYGVRDKYGEVVVCGYNKDNCPAVVHIEHEVQGMPVVQIRKGAFEYSDVTIVEVPSTINTISKGAFFACQNLEKICEYPVETAKYVYAPGWNHVHPWVFVDEFAFANCGSLTTVEFQKPFRYVYPSAFEDCTDLTSLCVRLGQVRKDAFKNCTSLKAIYFGDHAHIANDSIETSAIKNIFVENHLSYTQLVGKHIMKNAIKISCAANAAVAELAYAGYEVEIVT